MVYYIYDAYFGPFAVRGRQQDKEIQLVRLWVCLVPPKTPTKTSLSITSPSHPHHIETLNVANNPCMEY